MWAPEAFEKGKPILSKKPYLYFPPSTAQIRCLKVISDSNEASLQEGVLTGNRIFCPLPKLLVEKALWLVRNKVH